MKKVFLPAVAALVMMAASSAQAVTISFDYNAAADGSGKTSKLVGSNQAYFLETFDVRNNAGVVTGGGLTLGTDKVIVGPVNGSAGTLGYASGDLANHYAAPAGDSTYFAYGPDFASGASSAEVNFNYQPLLTSLGVGATLNYFGLYYGSIDTFNDVIFYNATGDILQTITGASLIAARNAVSGDQESDMTNLYVSLLFTEAERFTSFSFKTTSYAFEVDNLVVGYNIPSDVPEPGSLALLGLGLAGVGFARRRNKQA